MPTYRTITACLAFCLIIGCSSPEEASRPNIVYILADDLGYGEIGVQGQELIETPHIDALSESGMRFTQHYTGAPVCAPARAILMTGQHAGHAFVRGNDEWGSRGKVWDYQAMFDDPSLEGQRPLPDSLVTVAEVLQDAGYKTGMVGKWGLGSPGSEGVPNKQGFDFFYGYNCQRQAHTYYPMHLWRNDERHLLDNKFVPPHANFPEGADPDDPASYSDFDLNDFAPELMHTEALNFLDTTEGDPFFLYYASPIPHLPLQAPADWVKHYEEKFGPEETYTGTSYFPNRTPLATYAAMISYLDEQVGDLVAKLKELGVYENTLIIFTSDNGPSFTGGTDTPHFNSARPWSSESGRGKGWVYEGGIRVPMIASWPDRIAPGTTSDHISAFYDVMPTLAAVAGETPPSNIDGISFLPALEGQEQAAHDYMYWEFPSYTGQQAVRIGKWKGIRKGILNGNLDIELYNLETDLTEEDDIADAHPEIVDQIRAIMTSARTEPTTDRFKMEALGDVKMAYREAQSRAGDLGMQVADGYIQIGPSLDLVADPAAGTAAERLQSRLNATGGYGLSSTRRPNRKTVSFRLDPSIGSFEIDVTPEGIDVAAANQAGFDAGVEALLGLMDPSIMVDHEMHNPTWMVAAGRISGD